MNRTTSRTELTKELKKKLVNILLNEYIRLQYVYVLDVDAIFLKILFRKKEWKEIRYIPINNILYIEILDSKGGESSESIQI